MPVTHNISSNTCRRTPSATLLLCVVTLLGTVAVLTDGRDERRGERVVREPEQDARLAHARVADQQQFEQQIVRLLGHRGRWCLGGYVQFGQEQ